MSIVTTYWSPNQAAIAQVETYTFSAPNGVGNWYTATINGKSVTYVSVLSDTAATAATGLFNLLNQSAGIPAELLEITFANPSAGVVTATAKTPGTPFANVLGTSAGLVLSTGNGLSNGITTTHTQANLSPSDINDPQNWLRVNPPAPGVRALPQNTDAVVVGNTAVPMLWNLNQLSAIQFGSYQRWGSMTGQIGLPLVNPNGYMEWRAPYFWFVGPQGSVPAGGLGMVLGGGAPGNNPPFEQYNVGSQQSTLTILNGNVVSFLGVHTANTFTLLGGALLNVAAYPGEVATLTTSTVNGGGTLNIGPGVTWTAGTTLTVIGGIAVLNAAPTTLALSNGAQVAVTVDQLTWAAVTAQGNSLLSWQAGGIITTLTLTTGSALDKSQDARTLTITNATLDGDTCTVADPLNAITWTNFVTVKQAVTSGPFTFTGPRTVRIV